MKKLLTTGAFIALAHGANAQGFPPPIQDGLQIGGEVLLTYGNTHYGDNDFLGAAKLNFSGAAPMGDVRATIRGEVNYRTDMDDLPPDFDDTVNVEVALETGIGTFGYSTYHRCAGVGFPWTDGDVGNLGSANIHPWVPPTFRCAGGIGVYFADGGLAADDHFFYKHNIGKFAVNAWYDPDLNFEGEDRSDVDTVDGEPAPSFEADVTYDAGFARFMLGGNDRGDYKAKVTVPVAQTGLELAYEYNKTKAGLEWDGHIVTAMYFAKPGSILRMVRADAWYVENELGDTFDNWMVDVRLGQGDWELGLAYEGQGNFAAEGSYKINDSLSLVAGYDNGFETGDGWSAAFGPATSVPGRGDSYEIGLKMTF